MTSKLVKKKVVTIIGTRPEIIKMSPLISKFDTSFEHTLIHSGQHYSENMDKIFFEELQIREPDLVLSSGGLSPLEQIATILFGLEKLFNKDLPDIVVVHGDTNTTLAGAIAAAKYKEQGVRLVHVEAGCRSGNAVQTEEINRLLVDKVSDLLFTSTEADTQNLAKEGIVGSKVVLTGNTVVESCQRISKLCDATEYLLKYGIKSQNFVLATLHRQENVDDQSRLSSIIESLKVIANKITIILPLHPRTKKQMNLFGLNLEHTNIQIVEPFGYTEMMALVKNARFCMTDSGGLQEEASVLKTPTLVMRDETEYMHYVATGMLSLVGADKNKLIDMAEIWLTNEVEYQRVKNTEISFFSGITDLMITEMDKLE